MSSQSFIILKEQVISTTAKTPETKSNKSVSLVLETELFSWQWQFTNLQNVCLVSIEGESFPRSSWICIMAKKQARYLLFSALVHSRCVHYEAYKSQCAAIHSDESRPYESRSIPCCDLQSPYCTSNIKNGTLERHIAKPHDTFINLLILTDAFENSCSLLLR